MSLDGKVAIVTGGGQGIGYASAEALGHEGCRVVLVGRRIKVLTEAVANLSSSGVKAEAVNADVGTDGADDFIVQETTRKFGPPDILVNNAGILYSQPIEAVTSESWDEVMAANLKGAFFLARRCIEAMRPRGYGYVINISSTVALGVPANLATYGISKHGVVGMSEALWETVRGSGVKVSTIYPGITDTEMVRKINSGDPSQWMLPTDIAECILFLLRLSPRVIVKDIVPWSVQYDRI